ncbi:hypothetical protein [Phaeobacter gallaeciensis]|uniref:Uncharacterized protein n=1 Tax=Phaeobacter gallaeciensis TaxID=60890 RepID=A0AAD0EDD8_9RHOB|nr:hypothetical protein [Phaeobacter gallaeciensis]AHD10042.1 hypothetical protein Gal_02295 [Phaeobacter gallaeciensis DSM 26640]ATE93306.1 hypothetical protein PhaeoP11_02286 [Phaeobacter gallaeciensis]ATE96873.1 hypothetical protein PhaeoP73_01561 [Phaeobacter gallaeciensis]ATF01970.1 hypothetical protein PhaeoP75_02335 [Phaeobacter gallaeciensis]ATF06350.1 hypothetical protein PhaeoP63_02284 [Phaeobacter gallaeciensis]
MTDAGKEAVAGGDRLTQIEQLMLCVESDLSEPCLDTLWEETKRLLSENETLRAQLQAGRADYGCPDDETALNYIESTYGDDMRCAVSCMFDAIRALKSTSTEGEG